MHFENFGHSGTRFNFVIDPEYFGPDLALLMCITIMLIIIVIWGDLIIIWGNLVAYNCFILMCGSLGAYTFSHVVHTSEEDMRHLAEEDAACRNVWSS